MKIIVKNDKNNIIVERDFKGMEKDPALVAQTIVELELLQEELLSIYMEDEDAE